MKRRNHLLLSLVAACVVLASSSWAIAQEAVPFELELPSGAVEVELFNSRLDVVIEEGAQPLLRGFAAGGTAGPTPTFEVGSRGGRVRIARTPVDDGTQPARAIVELVLDPTQNLHVTGRELALNVHGPGQPDEEEPESSGPNKAKAPLPNVGSHSYELIDSEASLYGVLVSAVVAANTAVHSERGWGSMTIDLHWSTLTVRGHQGSASITAVESEASFEKFTGGVEFKLEGGVLQLRDGAGIVHGTSEGGLVAADYWNGAMTLTGTSATFEIRDGKTTQIKIEGTDSDLSLDGVIGNVNARLVGGGATVDSVRGNLSLTASASASVAVEDHRGPVALTLEEDATAELTEVSGKVAVKVTDSELTASGVESLDLTAANARVTADAVKRIAGLDIRLSEVELDLRSATDRKLTLSVVDESYVTVYLESPCRVQVRESADGGQGLSVTGCELQMENTGRWKGRRRKDIEGRPPFVLTAKVSKGGDLRVRGRN